MKNRIIDKLCSARFLIAVILTIVFSLLAIKQQLNNEFITIYSIIIAFYFNKNREEK